MISIFISIISHLNPLNIQITIIIFRSFLLNYCRISEVQEYKKLNHTPYLGFLITEPMVLLSKSQVQPWISVLLFYCKVTWLRDYIFACVSVYWSGILVCRVACQFVSSSMKCTVCTVYCLYGVLFVRCTSYYLSNIVSGLSYLLAESNVSQTSDTGEGTCSTQEDSGINVRALTWFNCSLLISIMGQWGCRIEKFEHKILR